MVFIRIADRNILSNVYLWIYSFFLSISILKISNINGQVISLVFNSAVILTIIINIFFILAFNKRKGFIIPLFLVLLYIIFVIFFKSKIATLQEIILVLISFNSNLIDKQSFIKYNFIFTLIPFIIVILLYVLHFIPGISPFAVYLPGASKGNALGFVHPNDTGEVVIGILIASFIFLSYSRYTKNKYFKLIYIYVMSISVFIAIIFYGITHCRELLYFEAITFFFFLFINSSIIKHIIYVLLIPFILIIPLLTIYWDYHYDPISTFYTHVDKWLSGRINIQNGIIHRYPLKFLQPLNKMANLSQSNNAYSESSYIIDNSFVNMAETFGILGLIIAAIIILRISVLAIRMKAYVLCVLILALVICNCIESSMFNTYLNASLLYTYVMYTNYTSNDLKNNYRDKKV